MVKINGENLDIAGKFTFREPVINEFIGSDFFDFIDFMDAMDLQPWLCFIILKYELCNIIHYVLCQLVFFCSLFYFTANKSRCFKALSDFPQKYTNCIQFNPKPHVDNSTPRFIYNFNMFEDFVNPFQQVIHKFVRNYF